MSRADDSTKPRDVRWREAGVGLYSAFRCMGCDKPRPALGARGTGVHRRCAQCLQARNGANA